MKFVIRLTFLLAFFPIAAQAAFSVGGERHHEGYAQTIEYKAAKNGTLLITETEESLEEALAKILDNRSFITVGTTSVKLKMSDMANLTTNSTQKVSTDRIEDNQMVPMIGYGHQWVDFGARLAWYGFDKIKYQGDPVLESGANFRYSAEVTQSAYMLEGQYNLYEIDWFQKWVNSFWPHVGAGVGVAWKTVKAKAQAGATGNRSTDSLGLAWNWHVGIQGQISAKLTMDAGYQSFELGSTKLPRVEDTYRVRLKSDKTTAKGPFIQVRYWF